MIPEMKYIKKDTPIESKCDFMQYIAESNFYKLKDIYCNMIQEGIKGLQDLEQWDLLGHFTILAKEKSIEILKKAEKFKDILKLYEKQLEFLKMNIPDMEKFYERSKQQNISNKIVVK